MDNTTFYTKHMLLQYGRQLVSSRRLARYHQLIGFGKAQEEIVNPGVKRQLMVERVTREVVDNLIFAGSDNPVVREVQQRLNDKLGENFIFQYPPGEIEFKILRQTDNTVVELNNEEKHLVMGKLIDITRETVEETML